MLRRFECFAEGRPIPQGSHTAFRGRVVAVNSRQLDEWRRRVAAAAYNQTPRAEGEVLFEQGVPLLLEAVFFMPRPAAHFRANGELKASAPLTHTIRPDLDKLLRAVGDALTMAEVWADDSQVVQTHGYKGYAGGQLGQQPGVAIRVSVAPSEGLPLWVSQIQ